MNELPASSAGETSMTTAGERPDRIDSGVADLSLEELEALVRARKGLQRARLLRQIVAEEEARRAMVSQQVGFQPAETDLPRERTRQPAGPDAGFTPTAVSPLVEETPGVLNRLAVAARRWLTGTGG
jgi:hypothetical protein